MKVYAQQPGDPAGTGVSLSRMDEIKAEREEFEQPALDSIKEILGPSRLDSIEEFVEKINLASAGPLYDLLEGPLHDEWKLTSKTTDPLRASAKQAYDDLVAKSHEIEAFVINRLASELDETSERKFLEVFGQPIKNTPANLSLLLIEWENFR